jgi:hypothetical protein
MDHGTRFWLLAALVCLFAHPGRADDYRTARVSDVRGHLTVRGEDEDDVSYVERNAVIRGGDTVWTAEETRAEIELERGSWIRLAEDTKIEIRGLPPSGEIRLWTGSLYLDLSDQLEGRLLIRTPAGDVEIPPASVVRVDLSKSESARVSVHHGKARVSGDVGGSRELLAGDRTYLEPDRPVEPPQRFDREDVDSFDRYHRERLDYYISRPLPRELERDILGARDLNDYGSWVVVDSVRYWRPRCEPSWRPYSYGYWGWAPGFGYTWIDYHPWGYTTSHYGRWLYRPVYGWLWCPQYAWGPSWVHWSNWGNYYGWAPLDPWNRPCYYGPGNFFAFNLAIDFRSWTFCDRDRFFHGRHHRRFAGGGRHFFAGHEVRLDPGRFRLVKDAHREIGVPRERVRGITFADDGRSARDRVLHVENRLPERRLKLIEDRFRVPGLRDRERASRASVVERFQRSPSERIEDDRILRGDEAVRRVLQGRQRVDVGDRDPGRARGGGDRNVPGAGRGPAPGGDRPDAGPGRPDPPSRGTRPGGDTPDGRRGLPGGAPGRSINPPGVTPGGGGDRTRPQDRDEGFRRGVPGGGGGRQETPPAGGRDFGQERAEEARRAAERQRQENDRREADRREADRREADRREAQRREADRQQAERQQAERRETERRETERRETERRETERRRGFAAPGDSPVRAQPFPGPGSRDERFRRNDPPTTTPGRSYRDFPSRGGGGSFPAPSPRTGDPGPRALPGGAYRDFPTPPARGGDRDGGFRRDAPGPSASPGGSRSLPSGPPGSYRSLPPSDRSGGRSYSPPSGSPGGRPSYSPPSGSPGGRPSYSPPSGRSYSPPSGRSYSPPSRSYGGGSGGGSASPGRSYGAPSRGSSGGSYGSGGYSRGSLGSRGGYSGGSGGRSYAGPSGGGGRSYSGGGSGGSSRGGGGRSSDSGRGSSGGGRSSGGRGGR